MYQNDKIFFLLTGSSVILMPSALKSLQFVLVALSLATRKRWTTLKAAKLTQRILIVYEQNKFLILGRDRTVMQESPVQYCSVQNEMSMTPTSNCDNKWRKPQMDC